LTEAQELLDLLQKEYSVYNSGWRELSWKGAELEGWETVDIKSLGSGRWSEYFDVITRSPAGNYYKWSYESGLTEYQEDYFAGEPPVRVFEDEETIVVKVWKEAGK
jgi:hypothetical protein